MPDRGVTLATIGKKGNLYMSKVQPVLGTARPSFTQQAPAFCAQLARVEVDADTGEVTLHDFVVVQDVGKAINPLGVEGQMQGGSVQSLGMAMTEGLLFDDNGRLTNPSLLDYRKLTAADLPDIETIIVEVPSPSGPFGARGVGEPPIVPAPACIANAVEDATGVRLTELPITPERIALGIVAAKGNGGREAVGFVARRSVAEERRGKRTGGRGGGAACRSAGRARRRPSLPAAIRVLWRRERDGVRDG